MTDTKAYVAEALKELELVKSEAALMAWHEANINTTEYVYQLTTEQVRELEEAYARKVAWFSGVGAG